MNVALRPDSLNLISICTGGGGLDLGVELAIPSARSVCLVEREAFGVTQLVSAMQQGLLGQAPVWSDARTFDGRAWRGAVDGLIGGIPCQPHSLAGKRLEREDPRDLWSTARRIIVQSGAWFVLIENVAGMLSSGGAERVYRDLGRLGFSREVGLFTAEEVGASHERERTFILGVADARRAGRQQIAGSSHGHEGQNEGRRAQHDHKPQRAGEGLADTGSARPQGSEPERPAGSRIEGSATERSGGSLVDAGGRRRDSRGRHGAQGHRPPQFEPANADIAMADAGGAERWAIERGRSIERDGQEGGWQQGSGGPELRSDETLFPPGPLDFDGWRYVLARSPELEPAFRRVADGLASRLDTARVDRLRMLGNGVVPLQAAYAVRTLATRLASRGSAGATRLVRMMEQPT